MCDRTICSFVVGALALEDIATAKVEQSQMVLQTPTSAKRQEPLVTWEKLPDDFILPDDPVENILQPPLAAALTDALGAANRLNSQMLIASNFGLVTTVDQKIVVKAPDWLYVPQVLPVPEGEIRRRYTPNLEGNPVGVVMEFLSDTEAGEYSERQRADVMANNLEQERQRNQMLMAKLQELGIDLNTLS